MEDGVSETDCVEAVTTTTTTTNRSPPPPPDPNLADASAAVPLIPNSTPKSDHACQLDNESWDINSLSALGALRTLMETLEKLAVATGDVPPTPPVSRPSTPKKQEALRHARRLSSTPRTAAGAADVPLTPIGSPEANPSEPITVDVGARAEDITLQHAAIARRFFSKVAPPFTLTEYLTRIHHYCPHSPAVYLAAGAYIHILCVSDLMVPATSRTIHRLSLAAIRIAAKTLEDNKWAQERMAKVGGVSNNQLMSLELTLCYLLDFDLFVDEKIMARRTFLLQQAAMHGIGARGRLDEQFKLRLPLRRKGTR